MLILALILHMLSFLVEFGFNSDPGLGEEYINKLFKKKIILIVGFVTIRLVNNNYSLDLNHRFKILEPSYYYYDATPNHKHID